MATAYADAGVPALFDTANYVFLGPTISVTVAAGNTIHVDGAAALGSTLAGGAQMSRLSACHQPMAGGALVDNDADYFFNVRAAANSRVPMAVIQRISGLVAGTYNVGLCYQMGVGQAVNWNSNDWVTLKVIVTQS